MSKVIELPHGIQLTVEGHPSSKMATAITCSEMESCPNCNDLFCESVECESLDPDEHHARNETNCRIEGMLSLIQNLYAFGFDHLIEEMKPAIESTMNDIANQD